jgi:hypothetical protein
LTIRGISVILISTNKTSEVKKMNKYEVWATVFSSELGKQVKICIGEFDEFVNASIFSKAYDEHYSAHSEIIEYVRK